MNRTIDACITSFNKGPLCKARQLLTWRVHLCRTHGNCYSICELLLNTRLAVLLRAWTSGPEVCGRPQNHVMICWTVLDPVLDYSLMQPVDRLNGFYANRCTVIQVCLSAFGFGGLSMRRSTYRFIFIKLNWSPYSTKEVSSVPLFTTMRTNRVNTRPFVFGRLQINTTSSFN